MQINLPFSTQKLSLPRRFEVLNEELSDQKIDLKTIVKKVDSAVEQVEKALGIIQSSKIGQFQIYFGLAGSGKTTFLRTLPIFFSKVEVQTIPRTTPIREAHTKIQASQEENTIIIIDDRDNPSETDVDLKYFFEELRLIFRKKEGRVLVIWPITEENEANRISEMAWNIGRDSLVPKDGAKYNFTGLPKSEFYDVANSTAECLNNGDNLDSFGISMKLGQQLLQDCETLSDYYSKIEKTALDIFQEKWRRLEEKSKPKVWILLAGDENTELERTANSLTQGIKREIDTRKVTSFLSDPENKSLYLEDWRSRESEAAFLLRTLDVRIFELPTSFSLAAIRRYGTNEAKKPLKKKTETQTNCHNAVNRSSIFKALTQNMVSGTGSIRRTKEEAQDEYLRVQQIAKSNDKILNSAIAESIDETLKNEGYTNFKINAEKRLLPGTPLIPDIMVDLGNNEFVCLEITWRRTDKAVENEVPKKQNTLTRGHIQKYVLTKVMEYIKALHL